MGKFLDEFLSISGRTSVDFTTREEYLEAALIRFAKADYFKKYNCSTCKGTIDCNFGQHRCAFAPISHKSMCEASCPKWEAPASFEANGFVCETCKYRGQAIVCGSKVCMKKVAKDRVGYGPPDKSGSCPLWEARDDIAKKYIKEINNG